MDDQVDEMLINLSRASGACLPSAVYQAQHSTDSKP
jgi:hypothetical protein